MAAVFSPLTQQDIELVAQSFGIAPLKGWDPIADGSVNTIYRLQNNAATFYLRLEEVKELDDLAVELEFASFLADKGFPTPKPLRPLAGGHPWYFLLPRLPAKAISLTARARGKALDLSAYDESHFHQVGALLGQLHVVGQGFSKRISDRFSPNSIAHKFDQLKPQLGAELQAFIDGIAAEIGWQRKLQTKRASLPQGIVHGDFFPDNLFFSQGKLTALIDFDAAARRELLFDLATAVNALCYRDGQFAFGLLRALFKGYEGVRPLNAEERAQWLSIWRLSSLRFTVTRIQDFHLRPKTDSGLIHRDFRDFYARLCLQQAESNELFWKKIGG